MPALTNGTERNEGFPLATFGVNVFGALLLGLLIEVLSRRRQETSAAEAIRLLAGTGFLCGFTTYSSFAAGTVALIAAEPATAILSATATMLVGSGATVAGIALGDQLTRRVDPAS